MKDSVLGKEDKLHPISARVIFNEVSNHKFTLTPPTLFLNSFFPNAPFLYPLKTSENLTWKIFYFLLHFDGPTLNSKLRFQLVIAIRLWNLFTTFFTTFLWVKLRRFKFESAALFLTWYSHSKFPKRLNIPVTIIRGPNNGTWDQIQMKSWK